MKPIERPDGFVVYRGASAIDGAPILGVVTLRSENRKTGNVASLWILPEGIHPAAHKRAGAASCCGACPVRDACYVQWGPGSVWRAYRRGSYPVVPPEELPGLLRGRVVRLGADGDPGALPAWALEALGWGTAGIVGYSHRWRERPDIKHLAMASVESPAGRAEAKRSGWRTFRVRPKGAPLEPGEIDCPSSRGVQCIDCRLCGGTARRAADISIEVHGSRAARFVEA